MTIKEKIEIARSWIVKGKFKYNGLTYIRGVNESSAQQILSEIMTMTISDLACNFDSIMTTSPSEGGIPAKGFTIGKGNKLYWFITPYPNSGTYRCLGHEADNTGYLGYPRFIESTTIVTIHY